MKKEYQNLIKQILKASPKDNVELLVLKRKWAKKNKVNILKNSDLLLVYREMLKKKSIKQSRGHEIENLLKKRAVRTQSGVAPVAVLTKPYKCPGKCAYCPTEKSMPKSYLSNEPAVMRAKLCDFHAFKQVALRIKALENNGHNASKIELIVMGGTWSYLPAKYRLWYIYACFKAANAPLIKIQEPKNIKINKKINLKTQSKITWQDLEKEQKKNEKAEHRIVGLTLETRPDYITEKSCWEMRKLGCTRVEIGVQHIDDKILKLNKRGHLVDETIRATKLLRDFGFKITYHLMPNLPGSTPAKDLKMFKEIFSNQNYCPDQIKIYPCVVTKGSELYKWWKQKKYKPYSEKILRKLLSDIKKIVPYWVRIIRVIRDIPEESIIAGNKITNLRHLLDTKCKCIRCREVGHVANPPSPSPSADEAGLRRAGSKLFIQKYKVGDPASSADKYAEYFLSYESLDRKILYAFCRLRLPKNKVGNKNWIKNISLIRELHTYGQLTPIGDKIKSNSQHKGLGKKLLIEAGKITKKAKFSQIAVISGIGVREYYYQQNYKLKDTYLIKKLK
ncbi:elongator complex protein 3 [Patescibacteria group bacterium]